LSGGFITLLAWLIFIGQDLAFSLERAVTVMVTTCPHALGLAIPLVIAVSTALSASNGLLIRNRTAFEKARNLDAMVFDKTGTLTQGKVGVSEVIPFKEAELDEILNYAASLEAYSEHPIARGVAAALENHLPVEDFKALPGKGVQGYINGRKVEVVSPGYLQEMGLSFDDEKLNFSPEKTFVFVVIDGQVEGALLLSDLIRPESREAVSGLKKMGIRTIMITGDRSEVAEWVAKELNLDQYFAEVLPGEKAEKIKQIQK